MTVNQFNQAISNKKLLYNKKNRILDKKTRKFLL